MFNVVVFAHLFGRTSCFGYATLLGDGRRVRAHLLGRVSIGGRQSAPPRTARENGDGEEDADATCTLMQPFLLVTPIPLSNIATLTSYLVLLCVRSLARSNLSLTD